MLSLHLNTKRSKFHGRICLAFSCLVDFFHLVQLTDTSYKIKTAYGDKNTSVGWGDGLVSKILVARAWGPQFRSLGLSLKQAEMGNPGAEELPRVAESRFWTHELQTKGESLLQCVRCREIREDAWCQPQAYVCMHTYMQWYVNIHEQVWKPHTQTYANK